MFSDFKNNLCNESKGIRKIGPQINVVVYGLLISAIPTDEKNTKQREKKHLQVGNGFPTSKPCFLTLKIPYAMNPRRSKK